MATHFFGTEASKHSDVAQPAYTANPENSDLIAEQLLHIEIMPPAEGPTPESPVQVRCKKGDKRFTVHGMARCKLRHRRHHHRLNG
jgi:hypothetical protein